MTRSFRKVVLAASLVALLAFVLPSSASADVIEDPYINLTDLNGGAVSFLTPFAPTSPDQNHFSKNTLGVNIFSLQVTATTTAADPFSLSSAYYVCNSSSMPAGHGNLIPSCIQVSFSSTKIVFLWTGLNLAPDAQFDWVTGPFDPAGPTGKTYWTDNTSFSVQANVPEPASMLLLGTGLLGLAGMLRRKLHR